MPNRKHIARRYVSSSSVPVPATAAAKAHPLAGVASQLDNVAPRFEIDPAQIDIIDSPAAFYEVLKVTSTAQDLETC